jgi:hypothetical protein
MRRGKSRRDGVDEPALRGVSYGLSNDPDEGKRFPLGTLRHSGNIHRNVQRSSSLCPPCRESHCRRSDDDRRRCRRPSSARAARVSVLATHLSLRAALTCGRAVGRVATGRPAGAAKARFSVLAAAGLVSPAARVLPTLAACGLVFRATSLASRRGEADLIGAAAVSATAGRPR